MADVRKLLQNERRLRETNKPKFNSSSTSSTKRNHLEIDDIAPTKRQKTMVNPSVGLPADFFGEKNQAGIDEVQAVDNRNNRPLSQVVERAGDASMSEAPGADANPPTLPSNFFEPKLSIPSTLRVEVDEDEWAAFQADISEPTRPVTTSVMVIEAAPTTNKLATEEQDTVEDHVKGEEEDAKQKLIDEFEEMESLEQRVLRLKERREALKSKAITMPQVQAIAIEVGPEDQGDEEDGDEDDDFFRARGSWST